MKKSLYMLLVPLALSVLAVVVVVPQAASAQTSTTVQCPAGFICTPVNPSTTSSTPVTPSTSICYSFPVNLDRGAHGAEVDALHAVLTSRGFTIDTNERSRMVGTELTVGYYGDSTVAAVKLFQAGSGLPATGFVGPLTRVKLNSACGPIIPTDYPGFFMTLDRTQYSLTNPSFDQAYLTLSRADNSSNPFGVDIYASRSNATSNVKLASNVAVSQNTLFKINLRDSVFQQGGNGQYTILLCATGQDCRIGVSSNTNRNSILMNVASTSTSGLSIDLTSNGIETKPNNYTVDYRVTFDRSRFNLASVTLELACSPDYVLWVASSSGKKVPCSNQTDLNTGADMERYADGDYRVSVIFTNSNTAWQPVVATAKAWGGLSGKTVIAHDYEMTNLPPSGSTVVTPDTTRKEQVRKLYLELQHREPDQQGWDYWVNTGIDIATMRQQMMQGIEYTTKAKITKIFKECGKGTPSDLDYMKWYYIAEYNGYNTEVVRQGLGCSTKEPIPVTPVKVPVITEFRTSHPITTDVRSTTLVWSAENATTCYLTGPNFDHNGAAYGAKEAISTGVLNSNATYTLSCRNETSWSSSKSLKIPVSVVNNPAPSARIWVDPQVVTVGQTATVSWSSENAASCTLGGIRANSTSGSQVITFTVPTTSTYTISCVNKEGVSTKAETSLTVQSDTSTSVIPAPKATFSIDGDSSHTYNVGETNYYKWSSENADTFSSSYTSTGGTVCGGGPWVANTARGISQTRISEAYAGCTWYVTYTATNSRTGQSASATVTVKVNPKTNTTQTPSVWNALRDLSW